MARVVSVVVVDVAVLVVAAGRASLAVRVLVVLLELVLADGADASIACDTEEGGIVSVVSVSVAHDRQSAAQCLLTRAVAVVALVARKPAGGSSVESACSAIEDVA